MTKSLVLAATALALSSAVALAQNAVSASAKSKQQIARQDKAAPKALYDYAPTHLSAYGNTPIIFGVAY
jgi:hypothetical protein